MQETKISYSFNANSNWHFFILIVFCILEFLALVIIFLWWLIVSRKGGDFILLLGLSLPIVLPIVTFYMFRKKSAEIITVLLSSIEMEIHWPSKKMVISFADIKSYSACRTWQETYDRESVRIRLKNGKNVRLTATSDICDIKPLGEFRETFDALAQKLEIQKKPTLEERLLIKK